MEALESLESDALVKRENLHFTWRETECGQSTEQFRRRVAGLNPQAGSRITPVVSGHTTGDDTVQGLAVASNTTGDAGEIARRRA